MTSNLHIDLDFFRAEADWYALNNLPQQKQVVWVGNAGMMRQLVARLRRAHHSTCTPIDGSTMRKPTGSVAFALSRARSAVTC